MQPGSTQPLIPSEVKEAFKHALYKNLEFAEWRDSNLRLHRDDDMPARVWKDGEQEWWQHDNRHRSNGLPAIIHLSGKMVWYENGEKTGNQDNPPPNALFPGQKTKSASKKQ